MPLYPFNQIIEDLTKKIYKPIYFLFGDEPYYIDQITDIIASSVLNAEEKTFNQVLLYGKDTDTGQLLDAVKRFPMMANHNVVIVKEAQEIKGFDDLIYYMENPLASTILVINYKYKSFDKRKRIYKVLDKSAVLFESKKLYDDQLPAWIEKYLKSRNFGMEPGVGMILTDYLGNDLSKITNELDKLIITLQDKEKTVTRASIEKYIGISKDYNNFELHKALTEKNILKSNRIINYFGQNQKDHHISLTISSLYYYFSKVLLFHHTRDKSKSNMAAVLKVNPFFIGEYSKAARAYTPSELERIISLLREYDMKSKGIGNVSVPPGELLKELVYKILH